jgi:hypothetical protein
MRVTGHDDREARRDRIQVESRNVVEHVEMPAVDLDNLGFRQAGRPRFLVDVASFGKDRSESTESFDDLGISDVAGVDQEVTSSQDMESLRSNDPVGIRDDADNDLFHGMVATRARAVRAARASAA